MIPSSAIIQMGTLKTPLPTTHTCRVLLINCVTGSKIITLGIIAVVIKLFKGFDNGHPWRECTKK